MAEPLSVPLSKRWMSEDGALQRRMAGVSRVEISEFDYDAEKYKAKYEGGSGKRPSGMVYLAPDALAPVGSQKKALANIQSKTLLGAYPDEFDIGSREYNLIENLIKMWERNA